MCKQLGILLLLICVNITCYALRDPTRPYGFRGSAEAKAQQKRYVLTSVLVAPTRRMAVLNGRLVRPGDRVGGAKVLAIKSDAVVLAIGSMKKTIPLVATSVKKMRPRRMTLDELKKKL